MSEAVKYNLPKVQLRVKTTGIDSITTEASCTLYKEFTPSILQERFKMKKEIQESFIRFRRRKKNNYIKQFSSTKKHSPNPEDKKINTLEIKAKTKQQEDKINFSLEAAESQIAQIHRRDTEKDNTHHFLQKLKDTIPSHIRDVISGSSNQNQLKTNVLSRHYSLYDTEMSHELKEQFELKGTRWNYCKQNQSKKLYTQIMKKKSHAKTKNVSGKSSTFKIDGWKPEKISRLAGYFECEQLEIDF